MCIMDMLIETDNNTKSTYLSETQMSYGAKGLLTYMLSLPSDYEFSINNLVESGKEGEDAIRSLLNELKQFGYIKVTRSVGS